MTWDLLILWLLAMAFCHIIADYNLQGCLANLKQKEWWKDNYPAYLYRNDYRIALFSHSFQWAFIVMLPCLYVNYAYGGEYFLIAAAGLFILNIIIHYLVDNLKANPTPYRRINLIEDQIFHYLQILFTWSILILFV